jgi:hypothetical protein
MIRFAVAANEAWEANRAEPSDETDAAAPSPHAIARADAAADAAADAGPDMRSLRVGIG